jgi:hypothetical protein
VEFREVCSYLIVREHRPGAAFVAQLSIGTYKAYNWKPPAGYRFTVRGLFEIKWY